MGASGKEGQLIWDQRVPDYWVVRGHVEDEIAIAAVLDEIGEHDDGFVVRHQWARWTWVPGEDGWPVSQLSLYWQQERAAFLVTVLYDARLWETRRKLRIRSGESPEVAHGA